ncbi:PREDICTED: tyrosine-protein phosphatase non-receptor type 4-like [Priapulus caudatus]|uniref:Moesin/ezrin/radixin homolog 1 n=1 Tax=Priapulus caudatus TaxID=37621 RepID=A0ABM1DS73_PRICU|nr:PREDICTED: tyrosine-protein phosphatase non-receptor type 4-like [Priapulus caudatus]
MSLNRLRASSGTYNVRESELARQYLRPERMLRCVVCFLDDTQQTFELERKAKGHALLDQAFQHLDLIEKDYFGLQYAEASGPAGLRWLDATKKIGKQVRTAEPYWFYFRVKFYVSDPSKLQEEYTRYFFFLQLKQDILRNVLVCPTSTAALLAGYAAQSELGDYNPDEHLSHYLSELRFIPGQTGEFEREVEEQHKQHKGQTPADAEFNYLEHAKRLDMYGVDLHQARDQSGVEIMLGVTAVGLVVFQNHVKINTFSWVKIIKISFKRKQFFIQLRREASEHSDSLIGFNMLSCRTCKELWKACVEHHTFFRLHVPKAPSRRHVFQIGSRFRYSGRTEHQTMQDCKKWGKVERTFERSPSKKYARRTVGGHTTDVIVEERTIDGLTNVPANTTRITAPPTNGTTTAYIRPYESFNNRLVAAATGASVVNTYVRPKKAWSSSEVAPPPPPSSRKPDEYTNGRSSIDHRSENGAESLVVIRIKPDEQGRFGFNVKGGCDQNMPVLVSRVAPNMPADLCTPRLNEGDQVLRINGNDISVMEHDQVVAYIRQSASNSTGLVLTVRPNVYVGDDEEPEAQCVPELQRVARTVPPNDRLPESVRILNDSLASGLTLEQFEQLYRRNVAMTMSDARASSNLSKNRYRDVSPYDQTRVKIQECPTGNYINANFVNMEIPTSGVVNRYIAAQGPLPNTCADFWQMIWEQQSSLVVMLTTKVERGRVKCHQYWPDLYETVDYGLLQVTCLKEEETPSFAFREFALVHLEVRARDGFLLRFTTAH